MIARYFDQKRQGPRSTAGAFSGIYRSDELERLREDWPT
jgi:hypothetical protein